ncbi:LPS-assembly protein LptD [Marinomonas aquiplantarum]|uniref:LPS-assembly protein LptD n=1 Tax=Marinomonas aquiplantarum TaxID=491951 RepID=A0A366D494_9GAMM|nr:LPS assembly protein LptD [Marinomonas aquiplantarum]RBO84852.1 lipopolysaccharide assembly outer membrane protein LptD (OstA) [Marinomonas aquiplantarum]
MVKHLRNYALFFQGLFILPLAHGQVDQWDWAPRESLTTEQQAQLGRYCQGQYVNQWQASQSNNTQLQADLITRDQTGVIHLQGNANIVQPDSQLSADTIQGIPNDYYQASGDVTLRTDNELIRSSNSYISNNGSAATEFENALFLSHSSKARGKAKSLTQEKNGVVFIEEGFFTTCEPNQESWSLYGSSIELNPTSGFGTAKHVQVRIAGIPVFYSPWLRFPIDDRRQSGFLFPSFGYSGNDGLSLSAPFYWNMAANYDATFTPQYIQKKGEGIDVEFRHLSSYGETTYEQSYFSDQDEGDQILLKLSSNQRFNQYLQSGFTYEASPTENEFPEANSTSIGEKDHYQQSAYVSLNSGNFFNKLTYLTYQTPDSSDDEPFEWQPRVESSYSIANTFLKYNLAVQYTDFYDPAEDDFDGERLVVNQDTSLDFGNDWLTLTPGILTQYRDYQLHDYSSDTDSETSLGHITTYLDTGLAFERRFTNENGTWRQTLSPRLNYLHSPYENQTNIPDFDASESTLTYSSAFSHERFNGNDRVGDTEQVSFGLESRLYDENNNEKWSLKAGQVFYLDDRYVDISGTTSDSSPVDDSEHSDLLTSASYYGSDFSLTANLNYDPDEDDINLAQLVASLTPADRVKVNLSYLYSINNSDSDDDAKQASFGTVFPINQNWSAFAQYSYDFMDDEATKQVSGVGYENCCIKVSLSYQDWIDDDNDADRGIFLQFILRSLSTAGRSNSNATSIADTYWNQGKTGY